MKRFVYAVTGMLFSFGLWAQSDANKGQIAGTVYDPNQAVVPGARVVIKNTATGVVREVTTSETGQFRAVLLDPGTYDITVEKSGFAQANLKDVILNVGSTVDLPVNLKVGTTVETVEVGATLVNVDLPAPSAIINTQAIENLPINGRRFQDFAQLTPTVQVDPERQQLSFVGQRGVNANVMLDGTDYNQPFFGGIRGGERSNFVMTVPQSAIQEFQAVTSGYAAEYGRSTGGVLNAITKSGSNDLHGEAFYQIRHKETGLSTPFNRQILETLQQFGGAAGGAIQKDKWFWFGAVERQLSKVPRIIHFGALDTFTPTPATQEAYSFYRSLEGPFQSTNDAVAVTGRTDYTFSNASRLTARFNFSNGNAANAASVGDAATTLTTNALTNNGTEKDRTDTGTAQYTSIISPTLVNDLRFEGSYELRPRLSNSALPNVSNTIGQFGARNFLPTTQDDSRYQINDGLSWTVGTHNLKVGFDYDYLTTFQTFGFNQFGVFSFNTSDIGTILTLMSGNGTNGTNRFDSPLLVYRHAIGNLQAGLNMHQIAFYGQDSWKVSPRLTLDFGLRWEGQLNPTPEANNTAVIQAVQAIRFPIGAKLDPTTIPDALNQVMPRFGFTFLPVKGSTRTVIRGHAGIFYASTPLIVYTGPENNFRIPPGDLSVTLPRPGSTVYKDLLSVGIDLNKVSLGSLPLIDIPTVTKAFSGGTTRDPFAGAGFTGMANDFKNPRSVQAGLGVEHEVVRNLLIGAQFNYVNTVHLERDRNYNLPAPVVKDASGRPIYGVTATGAANVPRPLPQYTDLTIKESSARSMYRGMTLDAAYRAGRVQFGANYSLAQVYSDDDSERTATGFNYDSSFNLKPEYGPSKLDARHQFSAYSVGNLPWGITLSGTIRARSGFPIDPLVGSDLNQDGSNTDRAYVSPGKEFQRNSFRNFMYKDVDLRFLKSFKFGEKRVLEFSTEMFNLFNWDNVVIAGRNLNYGPGIDSSGNTVAPLATFRRLKLADGTYDTVNTQVGTPFQAQFGLRFMF